MLFRSRHDPIWLGVAEQPVEALATHRPAPSWGPDGSLRAENASATPSGGEGSGARPDQAGSFAGITAVGSFPHTALLPTGAREAPSSSRDGDPGSGDAEGRGGDLLRQALEVALEVLG